jgi:SAM-dependent methyltransferase
MKASARAISGLHNKEMEPLDLSIPSRPDTMGAVCAVCGTMLHRSAERFEYGAYSVHRCMPCGSLVTLPLPSFEILQSYYSHFNEGYTAGMGHARYHVEMPKRWRARLRLLKRLGAKGKLLDLGGSNGMFASIANSSGFSVSVADFIAEPRDLGFTIAVPADLSVRGGVPFPDCAYDVVTLWSCIEHLRDPTACLQEVFRLSRPGALVAIDTPLVGDICERLFAYRSHWVCPPEHLHLFSDRGLRLAVERAGFDVVLHAPFFERTVLRWIARRSRNLFLAGLGFATRMLAERYWCECRDRRETAAGDIQFLVARKPGERSRGGRKVPPGLG